MFRMSIEDVHQQQEMQDLKLKLKQAEEANAELQAKLQSGSNDT